MRSLSHFRLFVTPWTVAYQAPPSMEFSRQENWSGLPFPSPGNLPDPGIKPRSPALQADSLSHEHPKYHILVHTLLAESQIMNGQTDTHTCSGVPNTVLDISRHLISLDILSYEILDKWAVFLYTKK